MFNFYSFKTSSATCSRLHHWLLKPFNAEAIPSLLIKIYMIRKFVFWAIINYFTNPWIWNDFKISCNDMSSCRITKHGAFTISRVKGISIYVKIWNKFIEIKNSISFGLVIFKTNNWRLLALRSKIRLTESGRELKNKSIECRPWFFKTSDKTISEAVSLFTAVFIYFSFYIPICLKPWLLCKTSIVITSYLVVLFPFCFVFMFYIFSYWNVSMVVNFFSGCPRCFLFSLCLYFHLFCIFVNVRSWF